MTIRVRFAPSPTGYLHVGGARTALFNWLFARKHKGTFILRVEDTDVERSSQEMTAGILDAMAWLGLEWNEGPYYQSARLKLYRNAAMRLAEQEYAYWCFCSPELLEEKRKEAVARKVDPRYDRACLALSREEVKRKLDAGTPGAIRFKVPEGPVKFSDVVFGDIVLGGENIEDFVLLRSDRYPTYHLSVVVDDIDMRVTHIIRGADHLSNTPKHVLLFRALGAQLPQFSHVPLILGPDKTRLSKRHGATSVVAYKDQGILPEAFRNFLALLGWSPGTDQEIFSDEELVQAFSLEGISKANSVFNPEKLLWFNSQYISGLPFDRLLGYLKDPFLQAGLWRSWFEDRDREWFNSLVDLLRPRARSLNDFVQHGRIYLLDEVEYDTSAIGRFFKDPKLAEYLPLLADRLEAIREFNAQTAETVLRGLAEELGLKAGVLINASRVALTGQGVAPGIFDVMAVLGKEKTTGRLRRAATQVGGTKK